MNGHALGRLLALTGFLVLLGLAGYVETLGL